MAEMSAELGAKLLRDRFAELLDYAKDLTKAGDASAHLSRWSDFENLLREIEHDSTSQAGLQEAWLAGFLAGANAYDRQRVHSSSGVCPACKDYLAEALDQVSRVEDFRLTEELSEERRRLSAGRGPSDA